MTLIHIYAPAVYSTCQVNHCPTCAQERRMLVQSTEWYGATLTCTGCGDKWTDGERHERPFSPGWRQQSREFAREKLALIGVQA